MSSDQLKQGLLLHLQTNRNFVEQKIYKQFAKQCIQQKDITTLNKKKMIEVIKFIFDFGSNQQMKPFYDKLQKNIDEFIKQEIINKPKNDKGNIPMDMENLYELVNFCVNNSFDKKQVKNSKPDKPVAKSNTQKPKQQIAKTKQSPRVKKQIVFQQVKSKLFQAKKVYEVKKQVIEQIKEKKPQITILNPQLQAKVGKMKLVVKPVQSIKAEARISCHLQIQKIPPKTQFKLQKHQMPNINVGPKYLQVFTSPKLKQQEEQINYQPIDQQFLKNQRNKKLMRQRLFQIYQHYCSQQQNKGYSPTFDRIKSQMEHMTLGKFLIFCKTTQIFKKVNSINKEYITSRYKKLASGKPQINFDQFQILIKQIDDKYIEQLKAFKTSNEIIPTYQARLMLHSNEGYIKNKKNLDMVFFSRDQKNKDIKIISGQFHKRDLTSHSGKIGKDLEQQVNRHRYRTVDLTENIKKSKISQQQQLSNSKSQNKKPKTLNLQEINMKQWPKIDWLQQEVKNQQNRIAQDSLPRIARRKDVVGNLKRRVQQVSKLQQNH